MTKIGTNNGHQKLLRVLQDGIRGAEARVRFMELLAERRGANMKHQTLNMKHETGRGKKI
jgi:hypothetical protein